MKYRIIVDKQPSTNPSNDKKTYEIDIEELRAKGTVHDSLMITKDEAYVIRRLSLSELHVLSVLENEVIERLEDLNITLFEGDNYIYLLDMTSNKFYAEYIVKNDFTEIYATRNEMNTAITQTTNAIELSVNQKLEGYSTTQEMNSAISQSATGIVSQVNNTLQNYSTTQQMNSAIEQKANSITSTVESKIDNIKVGGKNLLVNTATEKSINVNKTDGFVTFDPYATNNEKTLEELGFVAGDNVTLAFDWKISKNGSLASVYGNFRVEWVNGGTYIGLIKNPAGVFSANNTSGKFVITIQLTSQAIKANKVRIRIDNSALTFTISKMKLELGNVKTDWTPAPDDYTTALNTAKTEIKQTTDSISNTVSSKVGNNEVIAKLNLAVKNGQGIVELKGNKVIIDADNFKLTEKGNITATGGIIGGFSLGENEFTSNISLQYTYTDSDIERMKNIMMGNITPTAEDYEKYDLHQSGSIRATDLINIRRLINGENTGKGRFRLDTQNGIKSLQVISDDFGKVASIGLYGSYFTNIAGCYVNLKDALTIYSESADFECASIRRTGNKGYIVLSENNWPVISLNLESKGNITCISLTQTSLESEKKNFEKLENALDILKNIDIYKYNLKGEDDSTKKHIGFVIGENYKYSEEVTSAKNTGVDTYSFTSLCCKAIQEQQEVIQSQQEKIENLEKRLEALENGKN